MNLRRLKYFVKIVDIGSLTQAADVLLASRRSAAIATLEGGSPATAGAPSAA
jgi:LysR family nitrogen assimilation transcriptional regulator